MKYKVHYWRMNLVDLTGLEQGSEIDDAQLMQLISEQNVNVMIHHVKAVANSDEITTYCYIDDRNHRFQQR